MYGVYVNRKEEACAVVVRVRACDLGNSQLRCPAFSGPSKRRGAVLQPRLVWRRGRERAKDAKDERGGRLEINPPPGLQLKESPPPESTYPPFPPPQPYSIPHPHINGLQNKETQR